jgi:hypothetical protein
MKRTAPFRAALLALGLASRFAVAADTQLAQQDMYLDAMKSISEGRKGDASDTLTRMIEKEPQHAGAWLDLAIIQCELGHAEEAERMFRIIETRFAPPPGIAEVIANARASGCKGWQATQHASILAGRGIDSNVNQGASSPNFSIGSGSSRIDLVLLPEYLPQRDQYTFAAAEMTRELTTNGTLGFVQLRARKNDSLSQYDTASLQVGAEAPWRFGSWSVRGAGSLGLLTLGDRLYQRQAQLQARIVPPLNLPTYLQFSLVSGVTHVEYATLMNYDANTLEFGSQLSYRNGRTQAQANAGYIADDGKGGRPGGNRRGWYGGFQGSMPLPAGMLGELALTHQHWQGDAIYSPGLINEFRRQSTTLARVAVVVPVSDRHSVRAEFRAARNDENISIFQYNSRLFQVSWQWLAF